MMMDVLRPCAVYSALAGFTAAGPCKPVLLQLHTAVSVAGPGLPTWPGSSTCA